MTQAFEETTENYAILYQFSAQPYVQRSSWTTSKTFVPDPILEKSKSEFVLDPLYGSNDWTRTSNT